MSQNHRVVKYTKIEAYKGRRSNVVAIVTSINQKAGYLEEIEEDIFDPYKAVEVTSIILNNLLTWEKYLRIAEQRAYKDIVVHSVKKANPNLILNKSSRTLSILSKAHKDEPLDIFPGMNVSELLLNLNQAIIFYQDLLHHFKTLLVEKERN